MELQLRTGREQEHECTRLEQQRRERHKALSGVGLPLSAHSVGWRQLRQREQQRQRERHSDKRAQRDASVATRILQAESSFRTALL